MNSPGILLLLLGLILAMNLGLRRTPVSADPGRATGQFEGDPGDPTTAPAPYDLGSGAASRGKVFRGSRSPVSGGAVIRGGSGGQGNRNPSPGALGFPESLAEGPSISGFHSFMDGADAGSPDVSLLVQGLESATTPEERGAWADQIAARGGTAAVEALFRASLDRRFPEEAEVLHEAFKGFSTEEEMGALATCLVQTDDHDLIEAMVETLARGARPSTVEQLIRLHDEPSMPLEARAVVGWAIERIRNPEAEGTLVRWLDVPERPDWADAGIIALSALQAQRVREEIPPP